MPYIIVTHVMRCSHFSFKRMHTTRVYVIMLRAWHRQDGRAPPAATRIVQMIAELGFGGIEIWLLRMNWCLGLPYQLQWQTVAQVKVYHQECFHIPSPSEEHRLRGRGTVIIFTFHKWVWLRESSQGHGSGKNSYIYARTCDPVLSSVGRWRWLITWMCS